MALSQTAFSPLTSHNAPFPGERGLPQLDPSVFKLGMRRLASGVSVVTAAGEDGPVGLLSTSVSSVSAEPPVLLVCVNRSASTHGHIRKANAMCINILEKTDQEVADRFGSPDRRETRFEDRTWQPLATGAPALQGCAASFDCRIVGEMEVSTHTIFFGQVVAAIQWNEAFAPLLYWDGGYKSF